MRVKRMASKRARPMVSMQRILMATDFSTSSGEALTYAIHLVRALEADLYLLHVFVQPSYSDIGISSRSVWPVIHKWIQDLRDAESKRLAALTEEVRREGVTVHPLFKEGTPFLEILKTAEALPANLMVLGTHGRTGLAHALLGSVAERVVREASCPVLTVRPKAMVSKKKEKGA